MLSGEVIGYQEALLLVIRLLPSFRLLLLVKTHVQIKQTHCCFTQGYISSCNCSGIDFVG